MDKGGNGENGGNCSFSSYTIEGRGAAKRGESLYSRVAEQKTDGTRGRARMQQSSGSFGEARNMRRKDEGAELRFSPPTRVRRRQGGSAAAQAGSFALLLACICAFSLLFALKIAKSDLPGEALAVFRSTMNSQGAGEDEDGDERLGRLRLVQLPGLLSVFAASDSPIAPLTAEQAFTDDSFTARLFSTPGAQVVSILSGKVRSVDPAGEHGGSVTVSCKNGVDITYMGLGEITVERGQPVLQRTVIGRLSGETLYLRITRDGKPVDPIEFLGTAARVG